MQDDSPNTCQNCGFWRRDLPPDRRESLDYQSWRPCASSLRTGLVGPTVESVAGGRMLTSPATRCTRWLPIGAVHFPK